MSRAPHVLIVDDDHHLLDALPATLHLRMAPICVETADSAGAALERIRSVDYDVIVTDIKMPGMDGLALLREIQNIRPETPTLLISGHGEHHLTIEAIRGGAYDFIQKPIDRDYFIAAMQRAIQTGALRAEVARQREELEQHAARLEATVEARTRELKLANEAKDEFLGMISHEMRTPLTLISGGVGVLRARADSLQPEVREGVLHDIEMEAGRLTRIVEDLLVLARIELGEEVVAEPVSVRAVVERIAGAVRRNTPRCIEVDMEAGLPPVAAEQTYLERVLTNLISNADKYSHEGQPIRVRVGQHNEGTASISVEDAGPGVAAEEIELIFERFYRSGSTATRASGVGMGLTVCMRLVEAMAGRIWATHSPDGFAVTFTVPFYVDTERFATESAEAATV